MANQPDHVNSGALATMFALTALATVAAALAITALVRTEEGELTLVRNEPITHSYRTLRAEQETSLGTQPAWVDREAGLVSLPIERAMDLTLQDIRRGITVVGGTKAEESDSEDGAGTEADGADAPEEGAQEVPGEQPADGVGTPPGGEPATPGKPGTPGASPLNGQDSGKTKAPQGAAPTQGATPRGAPTQQDPGKSPAKDATPQGAQKPAEGSDH